MNETTVKYPKYKIEESVFEDGHSRYACYIKKNPMADWELICDYLPILKYSEAKEKIAAYEVERRSTTIISVLVHPQS